MKVFSYIVAYDTGFAPNPFHGCCTLACCKPKIRATASPGDLIIGLTHRSERIVYAMLVSEVVGFADYWADGRFAAKRARWLSRRAVDRCGDNIYEPTNGGVFRQLRSQHSNLDGSENAATKRRDLSSMRVLVGESFVYFGGQGPQVPEGLTFLSVHRGHRSRFTGDEVSRVGAWFGTQRMGVRGKPAIWPKAGSGSAGECTPRDA